jgi:hypothetical protein
MQIALAVVTLIFLLEAEWQVYLPFAAQMLEYVVQAVAAKEELE